MASAGPSGARTQGGLIASLFGRLRTQRHAASAAAVLALGALGLVLPTAQAQAAGVWKIEAQTNTTATLGHATVSTLTQGGGGANEVQSLEVEAGEGQFRLASGGEETADLEYNASPAALQAALEALSSIGADNVSVSGGPDPFFGFSHPYSIAFGGGKDVPELQALPGATPLAPVLVRYLVQLTNVGDVGEAIPPSPGGDSTNCQPGGAQPTNCYTLTAEFPPGLTPVEAQTSEGLEGASCNVDAAANSILCTVPGDSGSQQLVPKSTQYRKPVFIARLDPGVDPGEVLTTAFHIEGGGAANAPTTVEPTMVAGAPRPFGIDAFDAVATAGPSGEPETQAGGRPFSQVTSLDFNTREKPGFAFGSLWPVEPAHDAIAELPPGLLGDLADTPRCTSGELVGAGTGAAIIPLCEPETQVGIAQVRFNGYGSPNTQSLGLYNLEPPPGAAARFGFVFLGTVIVFDATIRNGSDYGVDIASRGISEGLPIQGSTVTLWGNPGSSVHGPERACPGKPFDAHPPCPTSAPEASILRNPTSCTAPGQGLATHLQVDSWDHPGDFVKATSVSHYAPGYPWPTGPSTFPTGWSGPTEQGPVAGIEGCDQVPFEPTVSVQPTTDAADSPSGLNLDVDIPQTCWDPGQQDSLCQSDLRNMTLALPEGMSVNPSAAAGRAACSTQEIGFKPGSSDPYEFTEAPAQCPDAAKIGKVEIETPLLDHSLSGSLYLAAQSDNPFGSLLATYLVVEDPVSGLVLKLPGEIESDPASGRLTTTFSDNPQLPFSHLHVEIFGGPRAALRTPPTCGTHTSKATLAPWSGNAPTQLTDSFSLSQGCAGGFDPHLAAGTQNPLAGAYSPFHLRLTREDGSEQIAALSAHLPSGLLAKLKGVSYCPESALAAIRSREGTLGTGAAEQSRPSCPASSRVGTLTVGAGSGPTPFYSQSGRLYLAGPYRGSPYSLAAVVPALAGPFDLGTVLVRNGVDLDPETTAIEVVSDPLPSILQGIPLDLRDIRVDVDRPEFTINPTDCDPLQLATTLTSTQGQSASPSVPFQVSGCERLGFKPKLSLALKGAVHRRAHPSLIAEVKGRPGDANIARAQVKLPAAAFLDNAHIGTVCTRVQFAAQQCPPDSVYGTATATTPLLNYPLAGNVYLRSSDHKLPDLVVALRGTYGEPIEVDLAGKTDSVKGALRNTFEVVPDAPVTNFHLRLFGGKRGLIELSSGLCAHPRASVHLTGQNGRSYHTTPVVKSDCGSKSRKHRKHRSRN